jgi:putative NADH-flavin reductase
MKIAVIGATGNAGACIVAEALARGHEVTGIARNTEKLPSNPKLKPAAVDVHDTDAVAKALAGNDAVVSSVRFISTDAPTILGAVKKAGVKRLLVVGGAGSLEVAPGQLLIDSPQFPAAAKGEAGAGKVFLDALRNEKDVDWTFLSPGAMFVHGERTGKFRLGGDQLLADSSGASKITFEDYCIAVLDELEKPKHSRKRFHVAY